MDTKAWIAVSVAVFIALSAYFTIGVDRTVWFDESFSLETVQEMKSSGVDFSQHDVHPPGYYGLLYSWLEVVPHEGYERFVGRGLSVLIGVLAILCMGLFFKELGLKEEKFGPVLLLMATSTTLIYYGNEMRMYILVVAMSAAAMLALVKWVNEMGRWWAGLCVALLAALPFVHYFSVFAYIPFTILAFILVRRRSGMRSAVLTSMAGVAIMIVATGLSFLMYAWPQIQRVEQMYLPPPTLLSYISSMFFSMHFVAENITGWWGLLLFLGFSAMVVVVTYLAFAKAKKGTGIEESVILLMLALGGTLPLLGFLGGVFQTYHHRYFLGVMWLFAFAFYYLLVDRWGKRAFAVLLVFNLMMFGVLVSTTDNEMRDATEWFAEEYGCQRVDVVHETAWTYLIFEVYKRERCTSKGLPGWDDWLSTRATEGQGRSSGEDVISLDRITRTDGYVTFPSEDPFFYVNVQQSNGTAWNMSEKVVWQGPFANFTYVYKS